MRSPLTGSAVAALEAMGLTMSDAIRLLLLRVADEKRLPFDVKTPSAKSRLAMKELAEGKGKRSASVAALFKEFWAFDVLAPVGRAGSNVTRQSGWTGHERHSARDLICSSIFGLAAAQEMSRPGEHLAFC